MKQHIFVALFLSAVLAIPGFSQQTSSNGSTPQAAPAQGTVSSRPPLKADTPTDFWDGDDPNLGNLITHPFANKKYVQRLVTPIRDRVNELEQLNSENGKAIKDTDSRAQQGLQLVSAKTSTADQHATDAATKAQSAQLAATDASTRVSTAEKMVGSVGQYTGGAQTEIRFRPGQTVLSKDAKDALDQMAVPLKDQRNYLIEVRGFSSGSGQVGIAASQKIADAVARYLLLNHQIPMYRISTVAMGNAAVTGGATTARRTSGGRVEVNLLKNDLASAQH